MPKKEPSEILCSPKVAVPISKPPKLKAKAKTRKAIPGLQFKCTTQAFPHITMGAIFKSSSGSYELRSLGPLGWNFVQPLTLEQAKLAKASSGEVLPSKKKKATPKAKSAKSKGKKPKDSSKPKKPKKAKKEKDKL